MDHTSPGTVEEWYGGPGSGEDFDGFTVYRTFVPYSEIIRKMSTSKTEQNPKSNTEFVSHLFKAHRYRCLPLYPASPLPYCN